MYNIYLRIYNIYYLLVYIIMNMKNIYDLTLVFTAR